MLSFQHFSGQSKIVLFGSLFRTKKHIKGSMCEKWAHSYRDFIPVYPKLLCSIKKKPKNVVRCSQRCIHTEKRKSKYEKLVQLNQLQAFDTQTFLTNHSIKDFQFNQNQIFDIKKRRERYCFLDISMEVFIFSDSIVFNRFVIMYISSK